MLRRVAIAVRVGLLLLGLLVLLWWPFSTRYLFAFFSPDAGAYTTPGAVLVWFDRGLQSTWGIRFGRNPFPVEFDDGLSHPLWPVYSNYLFQAALSLPLWLLAAVCLAWPVTSFFVRRRRRERGFEVEAKGGGAVSTADS